MATNNSTSFLNEKPSVNEAFSAHFKEERLKQLRELVGQERWAHQRQNITKAIEMFETGELPRPGWEEVYFANGKVIDKLPIGDVEKGTHFWVEVVYPIFTPYSSTILM